MTVLQFPFVPLGFFLAGLLYLVQIYDTSRGFQGFMSPSYLVVWLAGVGYWFYCVAQLHRVFELTFGSYPINPVEAWVYHLIPVFNFYWVFRWPAVMSQFIATHSNVPIMNGYFIGAMLLASLTIAKFFAPLGMAAYFGVTMYLAAKARACVLYVEAS
jgi:hypothetical protein